MRHDLLALAVLQLLALGAGCTSVGSSAYASGPRLAPSSAPVLLSATRDPSGAGALGVVEAHGDRRSASLAMIGDAFRSSVASLGGDAGRIDSFVTRWEIVTEAYTYACGGPKTPMTCTGSRQVEVPTFTLTGRAFKLAPGATP